MCWCFTSVFFSLHSEGLSQSKSLYTGEVSSVLKIVYSVLLLVLLGGCTKAA